MEDTSRQNKQMPYHVIEIVVPHEKWNASSVPNTAQDHQIDTLLIQALFYFWEAYNTRPTHPILTDHTGKH